MFKFTCCKNSAKWELISTQKGHHFPSFETTFSTKHWEPPTWSKQDASIGVVSNDFSASYLPRPKAWMKSVGSKTHQTIKVGCGSKKTCCVFLRFSLAVNTHCPFAFFMFHVIFCCCWLNCLVYMLLVVFEKVSSCDYSEPVDCFVQNVSHWTTTLLMISYCIVAAHSRNIILQKEFGQFHSPLSTRHSDWGVKITPHSNITNQPSRVGVRSYHPCKLQYTVPFILGE